MTLPKAEHTARPWRIHEIAPDFHVEDVWALPTPGGPDDFPRLIRQLSTFDPGEGSSRLVRAAVRDPLEGGGAARLGRRAVETDQPTLRDRLPADLRAAAPTAPPATLPFTPLYQLDDEWAAEVVNRTVHGVLHLGWVADGRGGHRGQMAVLVKRNGLLGTAYMAAITPFRHLIVYPRMLREIEREWERPRQDSNLRPAA